MLESKELKCKGDDGLVGVTELKRVMLSQCSVQSGVLGQRNTPLGAKRLRAPPGLLKRAAG
ncbi:uncharacterized [Tachysurus ichikawai]